MSKYLYTAITIENKKIRDAVEARDEEEFRRIMRSRNLFPVKFKALDEQRRSYRIKADETAEFCRQLSSMLSSGITIARAMEIFKQRGFKPKLKSMYEQMHKDIRQGLALSEAMRKQGTAFPELLINMAASGEETGRLENVLERMAVHYGKEHRQNGKIKSAARYPKVLGAATVIVVLIIFIIVLPRLFALLEDFELPLITRAVIGISNFLIEWWYLVLIAAFMLAALARELLAVPKVRLAFDKTKLRMPVIGKLLRTVYTARFSRTLSSLYSSGVSMLLSLEITGTVIINKYIESQFPALVRDVLNGEALSEAVRRIKGFDSKLPDTILVGEESGRLDTMLLAAADSFEYESEQAMGAIVAFSEPVMLVVMGLIILTVLLSVMLPMAALYEGLGI